MVVEVEFVPISVDEATPDEIQSLWQWVDETKIDSGLRRDMAANGLRVGRVIRKDRFRLRLDAMQSGEGVLDEFFFQASVASDVSHGGRRIPMRMGRRYELPVRQPIEGSHVTMARLDGELVGKNAAGSTIFVCHHSHIGSDRPASQLVVASRNSARFDASKMGR